jgi:hypothetical protein
LFIKIINYGVSLGAEITKVEPAEPEIDHTSGGIIGIILLIRRKE